MASGVRGKPTDGIVSRYINRRLSMRITRLILRYFPGTSPTTVTIITTIFGYLTFPLYFIGNSILGGIVAQLASILDGVDGELARARNMVSERGAFIDSILDRSVDIAMLFGASYYSMIYQGYYSPIDTLIYLVTVSGWIMVSYLHARIELNIGKEASLIIPRFASRDVRIFILFIGSIFGYVHQSLIATGILCYLYILIKFLKILSINR